jgi:hypothetical protein
MTPIEQIALGFELINVLNTVSSFHGPKWPEVVADYEPTIRAAQTAAGTGASVLQGAIALAKQARADGKTHVALTALAVGAHLARIAE